MKDILTDILPSLKKNQDKWRESLEKIKKNWLYWLQESKDSLPRFQKGFEAYVSQARTSLIWKLWRGEIEEAQKDMVHLCSVNIRTTDTTPELMKRILSAFQEIAEEEWKPIKSEFAILNDQLKRIIEDKILSKMGDTLYSLGK